MTKEELKKNRFLGVIEDNKDPKRLGRCKIRVFNIFDDIPVDDIPWARPRKDLAGNVCSIPDKGKVVSVIFDSGSIYKPEYISSEHYNVNLETKLKKLSESDYNSFKGVLFDHSTQVYRIKSQGLILDHEYTNVNLDESGNINLNLRNNDANIHIGDAGASQQAVLGNHFTDWMKRFLEVMSGTPFHGNLGAPVAMQPLILKNKEEFNAILTPQILSKNVKIVDNTYVKKQTRDYEEFYGDKWESTVSNNNLSEKNDNGGKVDEESANAEDNEKSQPKPGEGKSAEQKAADKKEQQKNKEEKVKPGPDKNYDIIFLCGLDNRVNQSTGKLTDLTKEQQTEIMKKEVGDKTICSFRYFDWQNCAKEINKNPNAFVVFFSAGCSYCKTVADKIKDKSILSRFYIVEPFAVSANTVKAVNDVVKMGVPVSNVIVGSLKLKDEKTGKLVESGRRGMGIIDGATETPSNYDHWGAIRYVSKFIK